MTKTQLVYSLAFFIVVFCFQRISFYCYQKPDNPASIPIGIATYACRLPALRISAHQQAKLIEHHFFLRPWLYFY